ncbi:MAG: serine/threonine-protein kinase [Planctomycetota bacterium]
MADSPSTPPGPRPEPPGDETTKRLEARKDTLAATGGSDFRHGRFEPGQRLGSRYRIVALLGQGGMGEVYRADDLELGQSVALKFLPERVVADESWLRRFRNEVRTARQVAHPNVCRIYDIAEEDGHVFLSMEYIDGEDLSSVLRRLGRPSREKAIEIARQICLGLAAAHDAKVLHRDLKPANIMIDGRGRVRITDFGLAGFLDELEQVEARAGTPAYMAPEQLTHGSVSIRSDIYTLGLILHELFTGKCVFETDDIEELKRKHTSGSVTPPSSITEEIDPAVEQVTMRCLQADPEHRPQSVYQVLAALPGSDPLAAALAAGQLPAPELVANARDAGGLSPRVAIGLVVTVLVALVVNYVAFSGTTVMPQHPPTRLSVVAEQIMEDLGFVDLPRISVSGYDGNQALSASLRTTPMTLEQLEESSWPPKYRYWRRWSTAGFHLSHFHVPEIYVVDAPVDEPGRTATIALDSAGRLLALSVAPDLVDPAREGAGEVDWSPIFEHARLSRDDVTPVETDLTPAIFCDTVVAWRLDAHTDDESPAIVLMGASKGRPNYFEYVDLRLDMFKFNHATLVAPEYGAGHAWVLFTLIMVFLAWRNVRAHRVDHSLAFRSALLIGGLYALMEIAAKFIGGSDVSAQIIDIGEGRGAGHFLLHAVQAWVFYLAIEPYVRRVWPRMLVGLIRILSGRLRDPAVGREVLIGLAAGCLLVTFMTLVLAIQWRFIGEEVANLAQSRSLRMIQSPGHYLIHQTHFIASAVMGGLGFAGLVVLSRLLVRHALASAILSVAAIGYFDVIFFIILMGDLKLGALVYAISVGISVVWLCTRIGVLAAMVFMIVTRSMGLFIIEFDEWSTPYNIVTLVSVLALAFYGFWVSLAGQPIFKGMLAEPQPAAQ